MTDRPNVLVTGGRGFIGTHLVAALAEAGFAVTSVDLTAPEERAAATGDAPRELVLDLRDADALHALVSEARFDAVLDLASLTTVGLPDAAYERNVEAVRSVLGAVEAADVPKYVFFSTQFVFRRPGVEPHAEDDYAPIEPYGASKARCEAEIRRRLDRGRYLILRPTYVWGPGLPRFRDGLLYRLARRQLLISADPRAARYYGYVRTVAAQAIAFARMDLAALDRRVYYLTDEAVPLRAFCAALVGALGQGGAIEVPPALIRALGWAGSALESVGMRAPINAMQARELTARFPVPAAATLAATGERTDLAAAAAETVAWARSDPRWTARIS